MKWSSKNNFPQSHYSKYSNKQVYWECDKGHEWQEKISNRTIKNNKCPFCYKRKTGTYKNLYNNFSLSPFSIKGEKK